MSWKAWQLDPPTLAVWVWIVWFAVWETVALARSDYYATFTAHLRPLFVELPLTWWIGIGLYGWLGVHIFVPALERWILEVIT